MRYLLAALLLLGTVGLTAPPTLGAEDVVVRGRFTEAGFPTDGGVRIVREGQRLVLVLDADFVTKPGPDLALFLSRRPVARLGNRDATRDTLRIGDLKRPRGGQRYPLPADVDATHYASVILHSETFSKLWGGADLR
ncbi:MAG: DM13 domain-containing protein [Acidobacteriota bacterium]